VKLEGIYWVEGMTGEL